MTVQGTMPKNSSILVQHWMLETVSSAAVIHWLMTAESLAILSSAGSGTSLVGM